MAASAAAPRRRPSESREAAGRTRAPARRVPPPLEHRILVTATLCLLAFGAVMVYSASSPLGVLNGKGNGTGEFVRYLIFGGIGLAAMHVLGRRGLALLDQRLVNLLLIGSFVLLILVLVPGFGVEVNGARRWFSAGPIQFQPSELMKLAIVLYVARYLADHPKRMRGIRQAIAPIAVVAGPACLLIVVEPDLGTTLVIVFSVTMLLIAAGMPMRHLALLALVAAAAVLLVVMIQPYQRARLTAFLHPWSSKSTAGFQAVQGQIAARVGRAARSRAGSLGAEDLLPARSPDRLHPRRHRRGARRPRDLRRGLPVRDDRLRRAADCAPGGRSVCQAARDWAHLTDSLPGHPQHLRGPRAWRRSPACHCRSSPTRRRTCA